jgi:heat-inducible transcriptional repressor
MLSARKQKILKAVVDEYIKGAAPVSSGEIKTKYFDDLSSATIRSELSTLEDMGFLSQPHTSAGRVPSPLAYKLYVENFLPKRTLGQQDIEKIDASFNVKFLEIQDIVKTAAKVISDVTNYTSVIVIKNIASVTIKEIKLVDLDKDTALVIIITDSGIIRDKVITLGSAKSEGFIPEAGILLNQIFAGKTVGELRSAHIAVDKKLEDFRELLDNVLEILMTYEQKEADVIMEGGAKMLDFPEADLESARGFLSVIENKNAMAELFDTGSGIEFSLRIGKDETKGMDKCAIVSAQYKVKGNVIGNVGVIGPERMDYSKVMSVLSYVGETLETIIKPE